MSFGLECKKVKRTGFFPALIVGGLFSAIVPVLNMAVRSDNYIRLENSPIQILMNANWQMMAMLNVLLFVVGACLMYHTEYADNGIQKMCTLPTKEKNLFFGKFVLLLVMGIVVLTLEASAIAFSTAYWFDTFSNWGLELLKCFGYAFLLMLPAVLSSLLIASLCKNMWVSLGIGVICVFTATMLPMNNFVVSLFPFALPFQMFVGAAENTVRNMIIASIAEIIIIAFVEVLLLKVRRSME
ncbi:MAG: ABC transporter permease [Clostridiales bacterium]|nr:ABC transporter permease [Clostridiales bacterium]